MKAVIFLGPSLPVEEARAIFPGAVFLPPARQSDLVSAVHVHRPNAIGLVDGEFGQSLSVWHKEILYALEEGIHVFGASSMGALRAAETADFGMVGIGEVFRMFRSGELTDDDEVALAHARDEHGWRGLSEPLVNVRVTLRAAVAAGVLDDETRGRLVAIGKELYFPERSYPRILRLAAERGEDPAALARLRDWVKANAVDAKRRDAVELVRTLRDLPPDLAPHVPTFTLSRTSYFEAQLQRDRSVRHDGTDVPLAAIATYAALHLPGFNELNFAALNRALAGALAEMLEVETTEEDLAAEERRFRVERGLSAPGALEGWMERNDVEPPHFREMMLRTAQARALHRWLMIRKTLERSTRWVLDELRFRGLYEETARAAARHERIAEEELHHFRESSYGDVDTLALVVDHMRATPCRMSTSWQQWAEEAGFHSPDDLRAEVLRARAVREHLTGLAAAAAG